MSASHVRGTFSSVWASDASGSVSTSLATSKPRDAISHWVEPRMNVLTHLLVRYGIKRNRGGGGLAEKW